MHTLLTFAVIASGIWAIVSACRRVVSAAIMFRGVRGACRTCFPNGTCAAARNSQSLAVDCSGELSSQKLILGCFDIYQH